MPHRLTRPIAVAAGLTLAAGVATAAVRLSRPDAAEVAHAFDGVESVLLIEEHQGQPGVDPCRVSAMLLGARPRAVHGRTYAVNGGLDGIVSLAVHDYGDPGAATRALRTAHDQVAQCRGFRSVTREGGTFRFEYLSLEKADVGADGYALRAAGRAEFDPGLRTDYRAFVFRRGRFVLNVGWQVDGQVDEARLGCLASLADARARGADGPHCSAARPISA